jgi:hypothetical protein
LTKTIRTTTINTIAYGGTVGANKVADSTIAHD